MWEPVVSDTAGSQPNTMWETSQKIRLKARTETRETVEKPNRSPTFRFLFMWDNPFFLGLIQFELDFLLLEAPHILSLAISPHCPLQSNCAIPEIRLHALASALLPQRRRPVPCFSIWEKFCTSKIMRDDDQLQPDLHCEASAGHPALYEIL